MTAVVVAAALHHTLIIIFCVRSIKISTSTSWQNGQHLLRAYWYYFFRRYFIWSALCWKCISIKMRECACVCFPAASLLPCGIFGMIQNDWRFIVGSSKCDIYDVEPNKRQNPSWRCREDNKRKKSISTQRFVLFMPFYDFSLGTILFSCFCSKRHFRWFDAIISSSLWMEIYGSWSIVYRILHHALAHPHLRKQ